MQLVVDLPHDCSRPRPWRPYVPLTAAGVLLWGLWNPTERLDTVTSAVVNLDEPVTVGTTTSRLSDHYGVEATLTAP